MCIYFFVVLFNLHCATVCIYIFYIIYLSCVYVRLSAAVLFLYDVSPFLPLAANKLCHKVKWLAENYGVYSLRLSRNIEI